MFLLFFILKINLINKVFAFPEMVTHGYVNCISCHVSPTGGGLLTPYGRALSKELLSAKDGNPNKVKNEEQFLKAYFTPTEKLNLGGDIRFLQMFMDNKMESSGRAILMQADLEAQWNFDPRLRVLGTFGRLENNSTAKDLKDNFISRRHWLNLLIGPDDNKEKYQIRAGRFFPAYGLNIAEHNTVTRRGLGFDEGQETYNAEFSYLGEEWNIISTIIAGRPDKKELDRENGGAILITKAFEGKNKVGLNFYSGNGVNHPSSDRRTLMGLHTIYLIAPRFYTLLEIDRSFTNKKSYGLYEYGKLGYEYSQGLHFYLAGEYEKPSILKFDKKIEALSIGVQYFPWVHWDLNAVLRREKNTFIMDSSSNIALLLFHYYL